MQNLGATCFDLIHFSLDFFGCPSFCSCCCSSLFVAWKQVQGRYQQSSAAVQSTPALWCRARSPELCSPIISGDPIRSRREELLSCSGCASISGVQFTRSFSIVILVVSRPTAGCSLRCSVSQVERSGLQGQQIRFSAAWSSSDFFLVKQLVL